MNRRLFLRGVGGAALALPLLPSLWSRSAKAQPFEVPLRYIQVFNPYSPTPELFYGALSAPQQLAGARVGPLQGTGAMSSIFGTSFDAVRGKLNVIRGIDVLTNNPNHQMCFASTASGYAPGLDGDGFPPQAGNESVDVILSNSAKMYPTSWPAARRLLNFNPLDTHDYTRARSFSWRRGANAVQMVAPLKRTQALLDVFMGGFGMGVTPQVDGRELTLMQAVNADYRRVRGSQKLSTEDRRKLDTYMALVDDLEREAGANLGTPGPSRSCAAPQPEPGMGPDALVRTQMRVLAAAMLCDLTRVGSITLGMSATHSTRHPQHHDIDRMRMAPDFLADYRGFAANVGWLMQHLDSISDTRGTLLDNSLVYWSMQYGCVVNRDFHSRTDMPIVLGGGAGGRITTGRYLDYRQAGGLLMNNFLVTLFNAMGLGSSDYERQGTVGYGLYTANPMPNRSDRGMWLSQAGKRTPVPQLYTGPALG